MRITTSSLRAGASTQIVCGAVDDAALAARPSRRPTKSHVHHGGFAVALPLAADQELLEDVREQLIGGHVLPSCQELAGGDLVENGRRFVVPGAVLTTSRSSALTAVCKRPL